MEKIIIALLLGVIVILLYLRVNVKNNHAPSKTEYDPLPGVHDIMGRAKPGGRPPQPKQAIEAENNSSAPVVHNFDTENKRETKLPIPQGEPDEGHIPDWDDEEEEMKGYAVNNSYSIDDGLATGVTYDELAAMGKILESNVLQVSEKERTVSVVSKIDGTELMRMLESSIVDSSRKIAMLLDNSLANDS